MISALILVMSACVAVSVAESEGYAGMAYPRSGYIRPQTANQINSEYAKQQMDIPTSRTELEECANQDCGGTKIIIVTCIVCCLCVRSCTSWSSPEVD